MQTECTLIGGPEIYDVNAAQPKIVPHSDILRACTVPRVKQGVANIACLRDQGISGSSLTAGVGHARDDLRLHTYGLVAARNKIIAEMMQQQQLSLKTHQGQRDRKSVV